MCSNTIKAQQQYSRQGLPVLKRPRLIGRRSWSALLSCAGSAFRNCTSESQAFAMHSLWETGDCGVDCQFETIIFSRTRRCTPRAGRCQTSLLQRGIGSWHCTVACSTQRAGRGKRAQTLCSMTPTRDSQMAAWKGPTTNCCVMTFSMLCTLW